MIPVIALVGRPNVGKSTLFNQLTRSRDALVADHAGLTRDRQYGQGAVEGQNFILIDTGGLSEEVDGIDFAMANQAWQAIEEADVIVLLVDARAGLTAGDEHIAGRLRRQTKPCLIAVNKTDGLDPDIALGDFYGLGLPLAPPIAATQGRGLKQLLQAILARTAKDADDTREVDEDALSAAEGEPDQSIRLAVIGRPNVGKSTLVNRILGEDRVLVFDEAGTTRDSIFIPYRRDDQNYTLIDTAGVRRRRSVSERVEKFSVIKTLQAIKQAHVVLLVMDAREGLTEQDLHLLGFALDDGRALVIAVNKWDGLDGDQRQKVKDQIQRRLVFARFAKVHFISALHGSGVGKLYASVREAYASATGSWSTNRLTRLLEDLVADHQPPMVRGRRIKLRYAHQGGSNPPRFIVHGKQTESLPAAYRRYLENRFIDALKISGTPVRFEFLSAENPYVQRDPRKITRRKLKRQR